MNGKSKLGLPEKSSCNKRHMSRNGDAVCLYLPEKQKIALDKKTERIQICYNLH